MSDDVVCALFSLNLLLVRCEVETPIRMEHRPIAHVFEDDALLSPLHSPLKGHDLLGNHAQHLSKQYNFEPKMIKLDRRLDRMCDVCGRDNATLLIPAAWNIYIYFLSHKSVPNFA